MFKDQNAPHNSVFSPRSKSNPPVIKDLCNSLGLNVLDLIQLTEEQLDHLIILQDAQGSLVKTLSPKSRPKSNDDIFKLKSYNVIVEPKSYEDAVTIKSNGDAVVFSKSTLNSDFTESNFSITFPFNYKIIKKKEPIFKPNIPINKRLSKNIKIPEVNKNGKSKKAPKKYYIPTDKRKSSKSSGSSRTVVSKTRIANKKQDDKILSSISLNKKKARPKQKLKKISKIIKKTTKLISKRNSKTEDSKAFTSIDSKLELTKADYKLSNEINVENSTDLTVGKKYVAEKEYNQIKKKPKGSSKIIKPLL